MVFVNGSIFNFKQWYPAFLPAFTKFTNNERSYLLYDYQGIGLSSFKANKFTMKDLVDELKQILDFLQLDKVHLFGASKGTMVSQAFAGTYPDRVASLGGYGVVNMYSEEEDMAETKKNFAERLEAMKTFENKFNDRMDKKTFNDILRDVYAPGLFFKPYSEFSLYQKIIFRIVKGKIWPMLDQSPIGTMAMLFDYYVNDLVNERTFFDDCLSNLQSIQHVLWLNGSIDQITPLSLVENLVKTLPNSSLIVFEGYGHVDPALSKKKAKNIMESYVSFLNKI